VLKWPERVEIDTPVAEQLIVELYSSRAGPGSTARFERTERERTTWQYARRSFRSRRSRTKSHGEPWRFLIEPLDRGFGYTFAIRCVACCSRRWRVRRLPREDEGVATSSRPSGVREDVTDVILNLKQLVCILHGESPEVEVRLTKRARAS